MDRKIVNIEDRLPKLKQEQRKKATKQVAVYLTVFFLLLFFILYIQSPLSKVTNVVVLGNYYLTDQQVIEATTIELRKTSFIAFPKSETREQLKSDKIIRDVTFKREWPNTIQVHVVENDTVGYIIKNNTFTPLLETGEVLEKGKDTYAYYDAPILMNWKSTDLLDDLAEQLAKTPKSIRSSISEIHHTPTKGNALALSLYMNDGFEVRISLPDLSGKMKKYTEIVSSIDSEQKGIIHLEVGSYFTPFNKTAPEEDKKNEN